MSPSQSQSTTVTQSHKPFVTPKDEREDVKEERDEEEDVKEEGDEEDGVKEVKEVGWDNNA
eukprot:m.90912 g.90912  ORF g.90912 m.90912 type:complete len:61 (-) comp12320_c0_seq2:97-279(-)